MNVHADVIAIVPGGLTGMQSHPYPQYSADGPDLGGESALSGHRCAHGVDRGREDDEEAVPFCADLSATPAANLVPNERALDRQRLAVPQPQLAQQPSGTLDVAEQQGQRRRWEELLHHLSMTSSHCAQWRNRDINECKETPAAAPAGAPVHSCVRMSGGLARRSRLGRLATLFSSRDFVGAAYGSVTPFADSLRVGRGR